MAQESGSHEHDVRNRSGGICVCCPGEDYCSHRRKMWAAHLYDSLSGMDDKEKVGVFLPAYCVITARFVPISGKAPTDSTTTLPGGPAPKK